MVPMAAVALTQERIKAFVGLEPKPGEILENSRLVLRTAADSIVILHAEHHMTAGAPRESPHVDGVRHVAEVQVPCGRRGVTSLHHLHTSVSDLQSQWLM